MRDKVAEPAADLHVALAHVARAIAESLEIGEVWDRVATACRTIAPFDAMGIVGLEGDQVHALGAAGDEQFRVLRHRFYPRSGFSPKLWPDADHFAVLVHDAQSELDLSFDNDSRLVGAGYRSVMRVPLTNAGRRLGSVLIMSRTPNLYTDVIPQELIPASRSHSVASATLIAAMASVRPSLQSLPSSPSPPASPITRSSAPRTSSSPTRAPTSTAPLPNRRSHPATACRKPRRRYSPFGGS